MGIAWRQWWCISRHLKVFLSKPPSNFTSVSSDVGAVHLSYCIAQHQPSFDNGLHVMFCSNLRVFCHYFWQLSSATMFISNFVSSASIFNCLQQSYSVPILVSSASICFSTYLEQLSLAAMLVFSAAVRQLFTTVRLHDRTGSRSYGFTIVQLRFLC